MSALKLMSIVKSNGFKLICFTLLFNIIFMTSNVREAEAADRCGIVDIISRVNATTLDQNNVNTFHNALYELIAEFTEQFGDSLELYDLSSETQGELLNEQAIMQQLGSNSTAGTKYLSCDYVIFTYLTNCNEVVVDKGIEKVYAVKADLSIRVIDKKTQKCVFVATGSGVSKARDYRMINIIKFKQFECPEEQFNSAIKDAAHQIALKVKQNI